MTESTSTRWSLAAELEQTKAAIKAAPGDSSLRVSFFQLLCVSGDWKRAAAQLELIESLDPASAMFAQAYFRAVKCEAARREVFAGSIAPVIFGEPDEWIAGMLESLRQGCQGDWDAASKAQSAAFEAAPTSSATINGKDAEWLADMDSRLGPILEAFIEGQYRWIPFNRLKRLVIDEPRHVVDTVWIGAHFTWTNGGTLRGLIPVRYPGVESCGNEDAMWARVTEWQERVPGFFTGVGQRTIATDGGEFGILDIREIVMNVNGA